MTQRLNPQDFTALPSSHESWVAGGAVPFSLQPCWIPVTTCVDGESENGELPLYLASLFISLVFLLVNLTCAVLVKTGNWERKVIVSVRVAINDTLFVLCAVSLSVCLYKISKMSLANIYLESKGSSVCQVTAIGVTVILLYTSRACYNLFILSFSQNKSVHSFDYDWYNVSDQADLKNQLGDAGYVLFGVVLFVWELLPTTLVVYFFRVRNPTKDLVSKLGIILAKLQSLSNGILKMQLFICLRIPQGAGSKTTLLVGSCWQKRFFKFQQSSKGSYDLENWR
ncbi:hypothetical protein P7K49_035432 [Saguinus oedipus]|uniref:Integral membrane protein GPR137B n=1 Tax=Saguinus oedipus TaxID=9490 RepID=A0ABQ9TMJ7_SAGOE|nr:hypothetical protein P7K49_035432 [Saguinus oedipus]